MATVAEALIGRPIACPRQEVQRKARPTPAPLKQDRDDSPFLHPASTDALVLAASALDVDSRGPRIVAVVLEDGSVRAAGAPRSGRRWSEGRIRGKDWTLWWQRRAWTKS
jgi:hypothetical protein